MRTLFLFALLLTFHSEITAQKAYGVRVGYNNTNVAGGSQFSKTASLNRFQAGVFAKLNVRNNWYLKGNLTYDQKGNYYDDTYHIADDSKKVNIKLNYLETSIDAGYSIKINAKQNINIEAGPYLAYGINGTEKGIGETLTGPINIDKKIDFINGQAKGGTILEFKRIDIGVNFNAEYQYKNYALFISYGLGLTDRETYAKSFYPETYGKSFNRVASLGVSYNFMRHRQ